MAGWWRGWVVRAVRHQQVVRRQWQQHRRHGSLSALCGCPRRSSNDLLMSPSSANLSSYTAPRPKRYRDLSKPVAAWTLHLHPGDGQEDARVLDAMRRAAPWLKEGELEELANASGIKDATSGHLLSWGDLQRPAHAGSRVVLVENKHGEAKAQTDPSQLRLEVLYEDDAIVCVNKPAGVPVQPQGQDRLFNILATLHHRFRREDGTDVVPRLVHRLDTDTSGVLILALHRKIAARMSALLESRQVAKQYSALVHGQLSGSGIVSAPIARATDAHDTKVQRFEVAEGGKPSETGWEARVTSAKWNASLVSFFPATGRTHQIRVHSHHMGHPLIYDDRYFPSKEQLAAPSLSQAANITRCALHCDQMTFLHPSTAEEMTVRAPWPQDFADAASLLQRGP